VDNNARVGELRGRPDQPPEEPDKPAEADAPDPPWNKTPDGSRLWRVIESADDRFAMPGESGLDKSRLTYEKPSPDDRPAERPPSGDELVEMDPPEGSRADKFRKRFMDKDTLETITDVTDGASETGAKYFGPRPPSKAEVCVPKPTHWEAPPQQSADGSQALTGMLVVGIMIGHGVMRLHRMRSKGIQSA